MSEQGAPQQNCPTSKRTATGTCGEGFIVHGVTHSCKLSDDHEGSHWCDCAASLPESQPSPSGDEWPKDRRRHQADRSPAEIFCTEHPCHDSVIENLLYNFDDAERDQIFAFADKYVAAIRSHDAKVSGQAEQRLKKSLLDMLHNHGCESGPCNACKSARAALQESPSDKTY